MSFLRVDQSWPRTVGRLLVALVAAIALTLGLAPGSAVADTGNTGISGRVTGSDGLLRTAEVTVFDAHFAAVSYAYTDSGGNYSTVAGGPLSAGTYYLQFNSPGYASEWFDNAASMAKAKPVVVQAGQLTTANAELAATPSIRGTVTSASGPVAHAYVCGFVTVADPTCTRSDAGGAYALTGLAPSAYRLRVQADGFATTYYGGSAATTALASATAIDLAAQPQQTGRSVRLIAGATVAGVVTLTDAAVGGATVCLSDGTCTTTDDQGHYSLQAPVGTVKLTASVYDDLSEVALRGGAELTTTGEQAYSASIALAEGTGVSGSVGGLDVGGDGWFSVDVGRVSAAGDLTYATGRSFEGTSFVFRDLDPGTYVVKVSAEGFATGYVGGTSSSTVVVTKGRITQASPVTLVALAKGALVGVVRDGSGAPMAGVTVNAEHGDTEVTDTTDANGNYTFTGLDSVEWSLDAIKDGYAGAYGSATVRPNRTRSAEPMYLLKASSLAGMVAGPDGEGVDGVGVYLTSDTDGHYSTATTAGGGLFSFSTLQAGHYAIEVTNTGGLAAKTTKLTLTEGQALTGLTVSLSSPATVSGTLVDQAGAPVLGGVSLVRSGESYSTSTEPGNEFSLSAAPGTYKLRAYADGYADTWLGDVTTSSASPSITLTGGQSLTGQKITMIPLGGVSVAGTVRTAAGQPTAGASVELEATDDTGHDYRATTTAADGAYQVLHVQPGTYRAYLSLWGSEYMCGSGAIACSPATLTVASQNLNAVDLTLPRLGSISGTISGRDGFDDAYVWVTDQNDHEIADAFIDSSSSSYVIENVPFGTYTLTFDPESGPSLSRTITVDGDEIEPFTFDPGRSISGTVTGGSNEQWVEVRAVDPKTRQVAARTGFSVPDGATRDYTLNGVLPGDYLLYLDGVRWDDSSEAVDTHLWYPDAPTPKAAGIVTMAANDLTGYDFSIPSAGTTATVTGRISLPAGVVSDDLGEDLSLSFSRTDVENVHTAQIQADGRYRITLPLGQYTVSLSAADDLGVAAVEQHLDLTGDRTLDLAPAAGTVLGSLSGRVVGADGIAGEDVDVVVTAGDASWRTGAGSRGFWTVSGLPAGTVSVQVDSRRAPAPTSATVVSGRDTFTGVQTLAAEARLKVKLAELTGDPSVLVVVTDTEGKELARDVMNAAGDTLTFSDLVAGDVLVQFAGKLIDPEWWQDGSSRATATVVHLKAGVTTTIAPQLTLSAAKPGRIAGTVTNHTGYDEGVVQVLATDGVNEWSTLTDEEGRYSLEVPAGNDFTVRFALCVGLWMGESECMGDRVIRWYDDVTSPDVASVVTVTAEQTTQVDATFAGSVASFATAGTPSVSGTAQVGNVLTVSPGTWDPVPTTLAYQWLRNGSAIAGATGNTYTLVAADAGTVISARVRASRDGYATTTRTSASTSAVAAAPTPTPTPTPSPTPTPTPTPTPVPVPPVDARPAPKSTKVSVPKLKAKKAAKVSFTVVGSGKVYPTGVVTVSEGTAKLGSAKLTAKLKGKLKVKIKGLKKGRHVLTVVYSGDKVYRPVTKTITVKVK